MSRRSTAETWRPQNPAIRVHLIDDDKAQIRKQRLPLRVVGQHRSVQHVGIRQHKIGLAADAPSLRGRRVAVVNAWPNGGRQLGIAAHQIQQSLELILRQRLCREQIERSRLRVAERRLQNRQVVAKRFAARRAGGDDKVAASPGRLQRFALVASRVVRCRGPPAAASTCQGEAFPARQTSPAAPATPRRGPIARRSPLRDRIRSMSAATSMIRPPICCPAITKSRFRPVSRTTTKQTFTIATRRAVTRSPLKATSASAAA